MEHNVLYNKNNMFYFWGMKLLKYLTDNEITPAEIAVKIGVTEKAVGHWLNGHRTPRPEQMVKIIEETRGSVTANDFLPSEHIHQSSLTTQSDEAA